MFDTVIDSVNGLDLISALICTGVSILLGFIISLIYISQSNYTKSYVATLVLLPALVQIVIMMVNGNIGTGVAVLGTFSLVRFRSVPGSSKEISMILFAMGIGLATGMGYIGFAVLMTVIICIAFYVLYRTKFGEQETLERHLKITIPENLDYSEIFDDVFELYTRKNELEKVKTVNLGSMYELVYSIILKDIKNEKMMIDEIRCRNGNLNIVCARRTAIKDEL